MLLLRCSNNELRGVLLELLILGKEILIKFPRWPNPEVDNGLAM